MSRADQRTRARLGLPKPKPRPSAPTPPSPAPPEPRCEACGCVHNPEQVAEADLLAAQGVLQARGAGYGVLQFRGDLSQIPGGPKRRRGFLIHPEIDVALSDAKWHRIEFVKLPNWRGRRQLRLARTPPAMSYWPGQSTSNIDARMMIQ